jgi:hypothetical protein
VLKAYDLDRLSFGPEYLIPKPFDPGCCGRWRRRWRWPPGRGPGPGAARPTSRSTGPSCGPGSSLLRPHQRHHRACQVPSQDGGVSARRRSAHHPGGPPGHRRRHRQPGPAGRHRPHPGAVDRARDRPRRHGGHRPGHRGRAPQAGTPAATGGAAALERHVRGPRRADGVRSERVRGVDGGAGEADAVLGGLTTFYPETIRPALQIIQLEEGAASPRRCTWSWWGASPTSSPTVRSTSSPPPSSSPRSRRPQRSRSPRPVRPGPAVAFLSYSDFGSALGEEPARVRRAVEMFRQARPEVPADGEMQADTAVVGELIRAGVRTVRSIGLGQRAGVPQPDGRQRRLQAPEPSRRRRGDRSHPHRALAKSVHVLQRDAEVGDVVNLTAIAVADAQRKAR